MKKLITLICAAMALLAVPAAGNIGVGTAPFEVKINSCVYGSDEYPFLYYHDITYMPLTYDMCRFAGISLRDISDEYLFDGYFISASLPEISELSSQPAQVKSVTAQFPERPAYIMENRLENYYRDADYPVLMYNGIVYMPLTWHVAVDLFDWDLSFTGRGLEIDTSSSVRPTVYRNRRFSPDYVFSRHEYAKIDPFVQGIVTVTYSDGKNKYEYKDFADAIMQKTGGYVAGWCAEMNENNAIVHSERPAVLSGGIVKLPCVLDIEGEYSEAELEMNLKTGTLTDVRILRKIKKGSLAGSR